MVVGNSVQVNRGVEYAAKVILYNPAVQTDNTVPAYTFINTAGVEYKPTIFDNNKTLFINNRDVYQTPGKNDNWVKFPKTTILQ